MKLAAACLIAIACIAAGQYYSIAASRRIQELESIQMMLSAIKSEFEYCLTPIDIILSKLCNRTEFKRLGFLHTCKESCMHGAPFPDAWSTALEDKKNTGSLKPGDKELLLSFGGSIGTTDLNGQLNLCRLYESLFEQALINAREIKAKNAKLYSRLGILAGMLIGVIVL